MLDLEIIPERSLRCENCWEFILGKYFHTKYLFFLFSHEKKEEEEQIIKMKQVYNLQYQ